MNCKLTLLLFGFTLIHGVLAGNNDPVIMNIEHNESMEKAFMEMEISGAIQLYSVLKEEIELIDTEIVQVANGKNASDWSLAYNRDYYIGYNDTTVEPISPSNFKKIAKKYFSNTPELAASVGKKGFRYKNLPTMILYYNNKMIEGKTISKKDKLLVKELDK